MRITTLASTEWAARLIRAQSQVRGPIRAEAAAVRAPLLRISPFHQNKMTSLAKSIKKIAPSSQHLWSTLFVFVCLTDAGAACCARRDTRTMMKCVVLGAMLVPGALESHW
jgi:hypothetical protein